MNIIGQLNRQKWILLDRRQLRKIIREAKPSKIILGSGSRQHREWLCTDYPVFDITSTIQWYYLFRNTQISEFLAEHVFEHLTEIQVFKSLSNINQYLKPGGTFHLSVPDSNHPNQIYIDHVRPGGSGAGADDHKSFWNIDSISELSKQIGFEVKPIEYCDENGKIITSDPENIAIPLVRSLSKGFKSKIENYSSLIVDLIKN